MASSLKKSKTDDWKVGELTWAHIKKNQWWPGIIVNNEDVGLPPPNGNQKLIFWYGDYRISKVHLKNICLFKDSFIAVYQICFKNLGMQWLKGVAEGIREYCPKSDMESHDLIEWALNGFNGMQRLPNTIYSEFVKSKLVKIKKINNDASQNLKAKRRASFTENEILQAIVLGKKTLESICLGCYSAQVCDEHPFFEGSVCKQCKLKLKTTIYTIGRDEIAYYCTICGSPGEVIVCDIPRCGRVFCDKCIDNLMLPGARKKILKQKPWKCFLCQKGNSTINGLIKPRSDWKLKIQQLSYNSSSTLILAPLVQENKHKLRVLSLFDGIGTALLTLDKLNIPIEHYYSCEIDTDALNITHSHYSDRITNLGNIKNITKDVIKDMGPIDLVVGGSPCNDFSRANPYKKGLFDPTGSGILVFEFYRILVTLQAVNDPPFFWIFENVASMPMKSKLLINKLFRCEPIAIEAAELSAQHRMRFFWGNLPTLQNYATPGEGPSLQEHLMPERSAVVSKLRTVTTRPNSLKQGPTMLLPVLNANNKEDKIWITELEEVFGFPQHYTDIANLSSGKRQKLIGKAWSVPIMCNLLRFLRDYYDIN